MRQAESTRSGPFHDRAETGYGFPCKPSADLGYFSRTLAVRSGMVLCKLHGSMNWRVYFSALLAFQPLLLDFKAMSDHC
jgi:hypothetical protein